MARASAARLPARRSFVKSSMSAEGFLGRVMASFTTAERVRRGLTPVQRGELHSGQNPSDTILNTVMPGLVPGIHVLGPATKDVDGRDVGAKQRSVARPAMTRGISNSHYSHPLPRQMASAAKQSIVRRS